MRSELKHRTDGTPVLDFIAGMPDELSQDLISLYQIVHSGEYGYQLSGAELEQFVSACLLGLFKAGARPALFDTPSGTWLLDSAYDECDPQKLMERVWQSGRRAESWRTLMAHILDNQNSCELERQPN